MIINKLLKYSIKKEVEKDTHHSFVNMDKVKTAGILVSDVGKNHKGLENLSKLLEKENIKVKVITYLEKNEILNAKLVNVYFDKKSIGLSGKFKEEKVKRFINTPFDYLFCLNTSPFLPFESILAQSKAKCRIGVSHQQNHKCYDIMLNSKEENLITLGNEMVRYLKMIKVK